MTMDKLEQIKNAVTANGMRGWTDERVGQAMLDYSDQQNAELLAKITHLEKSYAKFAKERDEQYGEYIDLNVSLRNENAELRERVRGVEAQVSDLTEIINGINGCRKISLPWPDKLENRVNKLWEEL